MNEDPQVLWTLKYHIKVHAYLGVYYKTQHPVVMENGGKEIVISERCTNIFKGTCGFLFNANIDLP